MSTAAAATPEKPQGFLATLKANLSAALADKLTLQNKLDAALSANTELQSRFDALNTEHVELQRCHSELDESAATLLSERDSATTEVARLKKQGAASAGAQELVATIIGADVTTLPAQQAASATDKDAHAKEYQRLMAEGNSTAAGEYFAKHREQILTK